MRAFVPVFASLGLVAASMGPFCDSCFVRGTRVSTEDGDRAIEDLVVGDVVLAFCPVEARVVARRVVALHRALVREVRTLTFVRQAQLRVSGLGQRGEDASSPFELPELTAVGGEDGLRWTVELVSEKDAETKVTLTGEGRTEDGLGCGFYRTVDVR